jgi:tRNA(fMet)-specific endonuclease VapC
MPLFILDTDHVSLFQRGHSVVVARVARTDERDIAVTIITYEEQLRGRLALIQNTSDGQRLATAYLRLRQMQQFYCDLRILEFNLAAAAMFERLRSSDRRVGTLDLRMASIALAHGGILVTRNTRDFAAVPSLQIEDWSAP